MAKSFEEKTRANLLKLKYVQGDKNAVVQLREICLSIVEQKKCSCTASTGCC